jgi:hypothetical protein
MDFDFTTSLAFFARQIAVTIRRPSREPFYQRGHVVERFCLAQREVRAQAIPIDLAHPGVAALPQLGKRATECGA